MFLERFTKLCEEKDVSAARVAADIGLSNSASTKWVKGSTPSGNTLKKIAAYFNVTVDYLIGEETKNAPSLSEERVLDEYDKEYLEISDELPPEIKKSLLDLARRYIQMKEGK